MWDVYCMRPCLPICSLSPPGPLSNLAYALQREGEALVSKIKAVWWMGGALHVAGNVYPGDMPYGSKTVDGSAEWNAFWDPVALGVVWGSAGAGRIAVPPPSQSLPWAPPGLLTPCFLSLLLLSATGYNSPFWREGWVLPLTPQGFSLIPRSLPLPPPPQCRW